MRETLIDWFLVTATTPTRPVQERPTSRWGRAIWTLAPLSLVVVGVALLLVATLTETDMVGQELFEGTAPSGDTLIPVNRTGYGLATFEVSVLPCPLLVYPLSEAEYDVFTETGTLPSLSLNCDSPTGSVGRPVSHLLLRNLDPTESMSYALQVEFYRVTQPMAWVGLPGAVLLLAGTIIIILRMLHRGLERLAGELELERRR